MQTNFNEIAKTINDNMRAKGFWDKERNLGEALMLVNTELCEGLEAVRGGKYSKMGEYLQGAVMIDEGQAPVEVKNQKKVLLFETTVKDTFEDEIADAFIRLLDLAGGYNIDLDTHIQEKTTYNLSRARLHGKSF